MSNKIDQSRRPGLEELEAFLQVADLGSFTKAAERLGLSKSIVSRRVRALERRLGVLLVSRTTHAVSLTDLGIDFQSRARKAIEDLDDAVDSVGTSAAAVRGLVRVSAPTNLGVLHVLPALTDLMAQHAGLEIDVDLNDRYVDVVGGGFDLAIRIGDLKDSSLMSRRLGTIRRAVVCSPDYIGRMGQPSTPDDLAHHDCLTYTNMSAADQWRFLVDGNWKAVRTRGRLRTNDGNALLAAALAGRGLVGLPTFITDRDVDRGRLVRVLENFALPSVGVFALFPSSARLPGRARAVMEHIRLHLQQSGF
ncbi:LysR family transcriptional regulator (plasmid) [Sinorhizobium garamanticum]|uniref:LysR family transcriptional regulator n=1 Tax=Sinorhizobium garamanticum TaxID=680247 RepID=A0ABY8DM68_9HYPH|nr:LysR family transcriptional regulator [Sinorhizobium garamanticum]WEX90028.1 LysR family transcriptional regulator [Sinorhizobium garamanticum]WEX91786.1 LysR family transcriptional regulator [Sinorhizobium garamanticum]